MRHDSLVGSRCGPFLAFAIAVAVSCDKAPVSRRTASPSNGDRVQSPSPDSSVARALAVVDRYLLYLTETSTPDTALYDSLQVCDPDYAATTALWVAAHRTLSGARRGDTVIVEAEVVSVAQQQESRERADEFVVEPRTRVDTLHFSVLETGHQGAGVCGYSREGLDLGSYGLRENTVFLHGSSREKLREVIDSIQRVRRP